MKPQGLLSVIIFTLFIWSCRSLFGCPTCVGRLDDKHSNKMPAFFQADFYTPKQTPPDQQPKPNFEVMTEALRRAAKEVKK